jgi:hypothetical protein
MYKNQISSLVINTTTNKIYNTGNSVLQFIFTQIFTVFNNLQYLNFNSLSYYQELSFDISRLTVSSSTLLELHINLKSTIDCLYLLDGRFSQLHTLHVKVSYIISSSQLSMYNKVNHFDEYLFKRINIIIILFLG